MIQKFLFDDLEADIRRREAPPHPRPIRKTRPTRLIVDPYRGCSIGCAYCFARGRACGADMSFETPAARVDGGAPRLRQLLSSSAGAAREIVIGCWTDPYQPMESEAGLTRRLLRELSVQTGLSITLATKSPLVVRDLDLLFELSRRNRLRVEISLMSLDEALLRLLEPAAPAPGARLAALRKLAGAGLAAGVVVAPVVAGLNDSLASLESVIRAAATARARFVDWLALTLPEATRQSLLERLAEMGGHSVERLRRLYPEGEEAPVFSQRLIATRIRELKMKYEIDDHGVSVQSQDASIRAVAS